MLMLIILCNVLYINITEAIEKNEIKEEEENVKVSGLINRSISRKIYLGPSSDNVLIECKSSSFYSRI